MIRLPRGLLPFRRGPGSSGPGSLGAERPGPDILGPERIADAVPAQTVAPDMAGMGPDDIPFSGTVGVSVIRPARLTRRTGVLLMIHGLGSDWDEHDRLAPLWAARYDMICLQIRDRHAGPRGLEIPVDLGKHQVVDALRAVLWALGRWRADRRRIVVWGGSGGGHMALLCGAYAPELFSAVIACCPFTPTLPGEIPGDWQDGWIRRCVPGGPVPSAARALRDPAGLAHRFACPVLLLHGDADPVTGIEHSHRILRAAQRQGAQVRLVTIPGGDHDFFGGPPGLASRKEATERHADTLLRASARRPGIFRAGPLAAGWSLQAGPDGLPVLRAGPPDTAGTGTGAPGPGSGDGRP